jgi:hypothetical protein
MMLLVGEDLLQEVGDVSLFLVTTISIVCVDIGYVLG